MEKMFFNILATFAKFESDLIKMRTPEGMKIARAKGKLRGKKPKLSEKQHRKLRRMYDTDRLLHQRPRRHLHRLKTDDLPNSQTYGECQLTSMNQNAATWVWPTIRLNRPTHVGHAPGSLASRESSFIRLGGPIYVVTPDSPTYKRRADDRSKARAKPSPSAIATRSNISSARSRRGRKIRFTGC